MGEKALIIDSRPSDAIAIAVRAHAPIFVVQHVIDQAKMNVPPAPPLDSGQTGQGASEQSEQAAAESEEPGESDLSTVDKNKWKDILDDLDPDDFKYKM